MKRWIGAYLILAIVFFYMLWINSLAPFISDDYRYSQNWEMTNHLQSWADIVYFQQMHYMQWGGRTVAHTLAQIMLLMGKPIFNVLNSLVFILFLLGVYYHVVGQVTKRLNTVLLMIILFFLWFCLPVLGETVIWLVGSCNYLWMITVILFFLLPYRLTVARIFEGSRLYEFPAGFSVIMFLGGIFAGGHRKIQA